MMTYEDSHVPSFFILQSQIIKLVQSANTTSDIYSLFIFPFSLFGLNHNVSPGCGSTSTRALALALALSCTCVHRSIFVFKPHAATAWSEKIWQMAKNVEQKSRTKGKRRKLEGLMDLAILEHIHTFLPAKSGFIIIVKIIALIFSYSLTNEMLNCCYINCVNALRLPLRLQIFQTNSRHENP